MMNTCSFEFDDRNNSRLREMRPLPTFIVCVDESEATVEEMSGFESTPEV